MVILCENTSKAWVDEGKGLNNLPLEILGTIFGNITAKRDFLNLRLLNHKFFDIVTNLKTFRRNFRFTMNLNALDSSRVDERVIAKFLAHKPSNVQLKMWLINAKFDSVRKIKLWRMLGSHITNLRIMFTSIDSDNFLLIFGNIPNVESLELSELSVDGSVNIRAFNNIVYRKLSSLTIDPIKSVDFKVFLDKASPNLRSFTSSHRETFHFDAKLMPDFLTVADGCNWYELFHKISESNTQFEVLKCNPRFKQLFLNHDDVIVKAFRQQTHLKWLEMVFLKPDLFEEISPYLDTVEKLKYIACYPSNATPTLIDFSNLKQLVELQIAHAKSYPRHFSISFGANANRKVRKLSVAPGILLPLSSIHSLTACFPNLTRLELKIHHSAALDLIFAHLLNLEELHLRFRVPTLKFKSSNLQNLVRFRTLTLCSDVTNYLNDQVMGVDLKFPALQELSVSRADLVTDEGIRQFVENNALVEKLHLDMPNLTDSSIEYIAEGLPRLSHLHITQLEKLTPRSVDHIIDKCTNLRYLNLDSELYTRSFLKLFSVKKLRCTGSFKDY